MSVIEIEIDGPRNECYFFPPLRRSVRGRLDTSRFSEVRGRLLYDKWPKGVPGQRLGIDPDTGEGYVYDGLHDASHADTRRKIEALGRKVPDERQDFQQCKVNNWLHAMKAAVDHGLARLVKGRFPAKIDKPESMSIFGSGESKTEAVLSKLQDQNERLTVAFEKLASALMSRK
jgi:hypothetical protein